MNEAFLRSMLFSGEIYLILIELHLISLIFYESDLLGTLGHTLYVLLIVMPVSKNCIPLERTVVKEKKEKSSM